MLRTGNILYPLTLKVEYLKRGCWWRFARRRTCCWFSKSMDGAGEGDAEEREANLGRGEFLRLVTFLVRGSCRRARFVDRVESSEGCLFISLDDASPLLAD